MESWWRGLQAGIRDLNPGYFAVVMATGIASRAMILEGARTLAGFLLGTGIVCFVILLGAYAWRLAGYRKEFFADVANPSRAFAFFTFVAGADVLSARLGGDSHTSAALALLILGGAGYLILGYGIPLLLARPSALAVARPVLGGANGTWFVWVVATQSIAVAITSLPLHVTQAQEDLAIGCWAVGVVLYLLIATMVSSALLQYPVQPAQLTPPYWVFMGATAISVLAGAQILGLPADPLGASVRSVIAGMSFVLWAFGTWLVPLLIAVGAWRHLVHRVPLWYEPGLWSIVFPIGMYGVGSRELGGVLDVSWLVTLGRYEGWLALGVWALVFLAMIVTLLWCSARLVLSASEG